MKRLSKQEFKIEFNKCAKKSKDFSIDLLQIATLQILINPVK